MEILASFKLAIQNGVNFRAFQRNQNIFLLVKVSLAFRHDLLVFLIFKKKKSCVYPKKHPPFQQLGWTISFYAYYVVHNSKNSPASQAKR